MATPDCTLPPARPSRRRLWLRPLTPAEHAAVAYAAESESGLMAIRARVLVAVVDGLSPLQAAAKVGCDPSTAYDIIHAFHQHGLLMLDPEAAQCARAKQRFWRQVQCGPDCWLWLGRLYRCGYGVCNGRLPEGRKETYAHRFAYTVTYGPIPEGLDCCHQCDNRRCVRPDHLFVGPRQANIDDMVSKGRQSKGEHQAGSKLTDDNVRAILAEPASWGVNTRLARRYGVMPSRISEIRSRKSWKHITLPTEAP